MTLSALRVCFPFVGDTVGGSHIAALELIKGLPQEGVEPVLVLHEDGAFARMLREKGVPFMNAPAVSLVQPSGIFSQVVAMTAAMPRLAGFLRRHRVDVVHTNDARMHFTWGPAARLAGARFVWHQHSADQSRRLSFYARLANDLLTVSRFCKSELADPLRSRARVVTNPFDTGLAVPDRRGARRALLDALALPKETRIVGYFNNFIARKRPDVFVEVAAKLSVYGPPLAFPMFGEPRERAAVDGLIARRSLETICPIMGFRTPVGFWMAACDVILAPAVREPYGRTLIESMLVGTPVIASADGGHLEIIEHGVNGLLAAPDNLEAFAAALEMLLRNPEDARAMADRAREHALRHHGIESHVKSVVAVYRGTQAPSLDAE
jgi:glycosyltransferase involved in cell wall biosynthesis